MAQHPAVDALRRALNAHRMGQAREALALSEAAYRIALEIPGGAPQVGAVQSFYGYMLGTAGRAPEQGLEICREALGKHFWEPRVYEHLARLELSVGHRRRAVDIAERGLALAPEDAELLAFRRSLGVRRMPPIPFLDRTHPINRWIGRMRASNAPRTRSHA